jgi:hypothetical protein
MTTRDQERGIEAASVDGGADEDEGMQSVRNEEATNGERLSAALCGRAGSVQAHLYKLICASP